MIHSISKIKAREILDSRGNPTVEVDVFAGKYMGRASVASGASVGSFEAIELRDKDQSRFHGKGVLQAVNNVNSIINNALKGFDVFDQSLIDKTLIELDSTQNKSKLGANAILGVSLACAKTATICKNIPFYEYIRSLHQVKFSNYCMPMPMMNLINGGAHADSSLEIQELMIVPIASKTIQDAIKMGAEIFYSLQVILKSKNLITNVGDEGGFAPNLPSTSAGLDLLMSAAEETGYKAHKDFAIAIDAAANEFFYTDSSCYKLENKILSSQELVNYYISLVKKYPIISIEDGMSENDATGWSLLTNALSDKCQIVGDDLFVTNCKKLKNGINKKIANSILIKPNQIGTLTETLETIAMAQKNNYACIVSHRSGETEDVSITHLAIGTNAGQIKSGSLSRTDRTAKYNELLRISESLPQNSKINLPLSYRLRI